MKTRFTIFTFLVSLIVLSGCGKDSADNGFCINFTAKAGSSDFQYGQTYQDYNGNDFTASLIQFYISDVYLIKPDNSEVKVLDVDLVKFSEENGNKANLAFNADEGDYKGIKFGIGLNPTINGGDPGEYSSEHPLSYEQDTYWTWAAKYIFLKFEGDGDLGNDGNIDDILNYHIGHDHNYNEITLTGSTFSIDKNGNGNIPLQFDVLKLFNGTTNIDIVANPTAHTSATDTTSMKFADNFASAFSMN